MEFNFYIICPLHITSKFKI